MGSVIMSGSFVLVIKPLLFCQTITLKDHVKKNECTVHQDIIIAMLNCAMDEQVRAT